MSSATAHSGDTSISTRLLSHLPRVSIRVPARRKHRDAVVAQFRATRGYDLTVEERIARLRGAPKS